MSEIQSDKEYAVLRNFHYKKKRLPYSVDVLTSEKVNNFSVSDDIVENRLQALYWIQGISSMAARASMDILSNSASTRAATTVYEYKSFPEMTYENEQQRMKVLHSIGWHYNGTFHDNKMISYYPGLAFHISVEKSGEEYYYVASFGIMRGSDNLGMYSRFMFLEDVIGFLLSELDHSGRDYIVRNILSSKVRSIINRSNPGKVPNSNEIRALIAENRKGVMATVDKEILSIINISSEIESIRRSADIHTLHDFCKLFLIPLSKKMYEKALEHKHDSELALNLAESDSAEGVIDIDANSEAAHDIDYSVESPEDVDNYDSHAADVTSAGVGISTVADSGLRGISDQDVDVPDTDVSYDSDEDDSAYDSDEDDEATALDSIPEEDIDRAMGDNGGIDKSFNELMDNIFTGSITSGEKKSSKEKTREDKLEEIIDGFLGE